MENWRFDDKSSCKHKASSQSHERLYLIERDTVGVIVTTWPPRDPLYLCNLPLKPCLASTPTVSQIYSLAQSWRRSAEIVERCVCIWGFEDASGRGDVEVTAGPCHASAEQPVSTTAASSYNKCLQHVH